MTIDSPCVLLVQNDVQAGRESEFDAWYLADHMPDRVGTPGFRRARRWRAFSGGPRDLSLYEIDGPEVMSSPAYLARLAAPTMGTRHNMSAFIGMRRSVCEVSAATGFADGGYAALLPVTEPDAGHVAALPGAACWRANTGKGVVASALVRCDAAASRSDSVESRMRAGKDQTIAIAAWIEAATAEQLRDAADEIAELLRSAGLASGPAVLLSLNATFTARAA